MILAIQEVRWLGDGSISWTIPRTDEGDQILFSKKLEKNKPRRILLNGNADSDHLLVIAHGIQIR